MNTEGPWMSAPQDVLWIGGSSGTGKSTVARFLARRHGFRWYSTDTRTWEHRDRAIALNDQPAIEWERLTPAQRSVLSPIDKARLEFDRSTMVLADVAALPDRPAVVAEGTTITPAMVPRDGLAVWLTAPPAVRASRAKDRGWGAAGSEADLLNERNLLQELDQASIRPIDTSRETDPLQTLERIETIAADWLDLRPGADDDDERRALIREGNAAIVEQYRRGMKRSGNPAGADLTRAYDCECGDRGCIALVMRSLGSLPEPFLMDSPPILAHDHRQ